MHVLSVLLSSTLRDLEKERERLLEAIERRKLHAIGLERYWLDAPGQITAEFCEELARRADVYIGVLAWAYGSISAERGKSYTEVELDAALAAGKECHVFVIKGDPGEAPRMAFDRGPDAWALGQRLEQLKKRVKSSRMIYCYSYERLDDLVDGVHEALHAWFTRAQPASANAHGGPSNVDPDIRNYLRVAADRYSRIQLLGFAKEVRASLSLSEMYVELRGTPDERMIIEKHYKNVDEASEELSARGNSRDLSMEDAFAAAWARGKRRSIVILGEPGSGKTTYLKRVFVTLAEGNGKQLGDDLADAVPIFLPLRTLAEGEPTLESLLERQLAELKLPNPAALRDRLLALPKVVFLLDGLDEVHDAAVASGAPPADSTKRGAAVADRAAVLRWLAEIEHRYPNARCALTCRIAGFPHEERHGSDCLLFYLQPLKAERIEEFVYNWFRLVAVHTKGSSDSAIAEGRKRSDDLVKRIHKAQEDARAKRLLEMAENPLLLTAICLVFYDRHGNLPERRADLYEDCIRILARTWREAAGLKAFLDEGRIRALLQPIAWFLHKRGEGSPENPQGLRATAAELEAVLAPELAKHEATRSLSAKRFLTQIRDESGLLTGFSGDRFGFMHLGLQEYLAARHVRERGAQELLDRNNTSRESATLAELASRFGNPYWDEVILLLLATDGTDAFPAYEELYRWLLAHTPNFDEHSSLCGLARSEATGKSASPFLEVLRRDPGTSRAFHDQQTVALWELLFIDPQALDSKLRERLRSHPSLSVRAQIEAKFPAEAKAAGSRVGGQRFIEPKTGMRLVRIPAGSFWMGSTHEELGHQKDESPIHRVTLTKDYWLGATQVTNQQYECFLAANPEAPKPELWTSRRFNQPEQPVVGVSWEEAMAFCNWLGAGATLPTEAQWERACRGIHESPLPFGFSVDSDLLKRGGEELKKHLETTLQRFAWFDANSSNVTHPVGEKEPNGLGLFDMHGNVWEWCADWLGEYHKGGESDPSGARAGADRVLRGGSYWDDADGCRSAYRNWLQPSVRDDYIGFRVCFPAAPAG